jgi:hypothetical protein
MNLNKQITFLFISVLCAIIVTGGCLYSYLYDSNGDLIEKIMKELKQKELINRKKILTPIK